ncbi:response regulator transcription factor [uncultured Pseudacidovorax sp.]|uniref:response regulator transcription factor n=1 Tax=uncultured Pseudacidovorax sp. TaxID=679313 RepID=UPI0025F7BDB3|nr:response regulator transcription factor [uncultured Pseudacidovorax sp.]
MAPPSETSPARVALVEDDAGMRQRIAQAVQGDADLSLAFEAATAQQILDWLPGHAVDVLLVDLGLPDRSGLEVIRAARQLQPDCAVMVITIFGDEANMVKAFEAGASGYLLKDGTERDLGLHIRSLRAGGSPMSPIIARQLLRRWQQSGVGAAAPAEPIAPAPVAGTPHAAERLSPREFEVLDLVSRGFTYAETATRIGVSVSTVQTHVRNIYSKLDVHNKSEAVYEARNLGLLR